MLKVLSDVLVLKNAIMRKDEINNLFIINLSFRNLDGKIINQSFSYHNYDEAVNDFLIISNTIKEDK